MLQFSVERDNYLNRGKMLEKENIINWITKKKKQKGIKPLLTISKIWLIVVLQT